MLDSLLDTLADGLRKPLPNVIVLCMRVGAKRAAKALQARGVLIVVWMQVDAVTDELAAKSLLGFVQPLLEKLRSRAFAPRGELSISSLQSA